jgi:hypothetical protein
MGQSQTKEDYIQPQREIPKTSQSTTNIQKPSQEVQQTYQLIQNPYIQPPQVKKEIIPTIKYKGGN